jgi:hypothetical protein
MMPFDLKSKTGLPSGAASPCRLLAANTGKKCPIFDKGRVEAHTAAF